MNVLETGDDVYNVYSHLEWFAERDFARRIANGRTAEDAKSDVKKALLATFFGSPVFAIRNYFYTVSKEGDLVKIDPWRGQTMLDYALECQRRRGLPQRIVEIKARQVGFTAWNLARAFWAALHPRMKVGVLVNDDDVAATLMLRVGEMYNNLPRWLRPMKRIENVKQLVLDNPNARERDTRPGLGSNISITVPNSLRGFTPNYFVWSEAAFCANWQEVSDGVISGMGAHGRSCVVLDTTPNGYDDFYWPLVQQSVARNPKWVARWDGPAPSREEIIAGGLGEPDDLKGWIPVFCPWRWHEEFTTKDEEADFGQLPMLDDKELQHLRATLGKKDEYGGEEELELTERYGVSLYRIAWRRFKINDNQGADPYMKLLKFRQEYPTTWRSGFLTFGRGAFDARGLDKLGTYLGPGSKYGPRPPLARGCLRRDDRGEVYVDQTFISDWLEVRVWALPDPHEEYCMGVDTALTYGHDGCDYTTFQIIRRRDRKQVAAMSARCDPDTYREQCYLAYRWYNNAYLGIEMEADGFDLAVTLWARGCTNQYFYQRSDVPPETNPTQGLGWETNNKSRWRLQNVLIAAIARKDANDQPEPDVIICDEQTMTEFQEVTRSPEGFIENTSGGHDDHFMSLGIALTIDEDPWKPYTRQRPRSKDSVPMNGLLDHIGFTVASRRSRNSPAYEDI